MGTIQQCEMKKSLLQFIFLLATLVLLPGQCLAQDLKQPLPESKAVKHGVLKNGMKYYICTTEKDRKADFYVIQPTGSTVEREGEYGLAHFVEHLVFRGTKNFKRWEIIDRVRKMGAQFGPDLNAGTSYEVTFYSFKNIPLWNDEVSTDCLRMLCDMMYFAELNDNDIEKERNAIIEEGLARRDGNEEFAGTPFARPVIGDTATILHCSPQTIRDFYHRWYQPQMQAVVAIGPFDTDRMYEKIRDIFEAVPAGTASVPARAVLPSFTEPRVFIKNPDFSKVSVDLYIRQPMMADSLKCTVGGLLPSVAVSALTTPISETFHRLYGQDIACLTSYGKDYDNAPVLKFSILSEKYGPKEVLSKSLKTIKSIVDLGLPDEIADKYRAEYADDLEKADSLAWESNDSLVSNTDPLFEDCMANFLYGTPIMDEKDKIKIWTNLKGKYDLDAFREILRQSVYAPDKTIFVNIPKNCEVTKDEIREVIDNAFQTVAVPIVLPPRKKSAEEIKDSLVSTVNPTPGRIVSKSSLQNGKVRKIGLSNGVTVLLHQLDGMERKQMGEPFLEGKFCNLYAYREGGISAVDSSRYRLTVLMKDNKDVGNSISRYYDFWEMSFIYPNDMEKRFREFYYNLTDVNISKEDSIRLSEQLRNAVQSPTNEAEEQFVKAFFLPRDTSGREPLDSVMTADDFRQMKEGWREYKSNYNGMVVAIDCVESIDSVMPYVLKYIGSLPYKKEPMRMRDVDHFICQDSVMVEPSVDPMQETYSLILFQKQGFAYTEENVMLHNALESVLYNIVVNSIRLQNADNYSPYVKADIDLWPEVQQTYRIYLSFARGKSDKIESNVKQLLHDMAYGDAITQQMIDDHIKSIYASGGKYPQGGEAYKQLLRIMDKGVAVDTRTMKLEKVITLEGVRKYLRSLLEHGHYYEYKNKD